MKKLVLISSYCDTSEKKNVLKKNIITLKNNSADVLLISPIVLDNDIVSLCDYYFYTKENPILRWPLRANTFWYSFTNKFGKKITLHRDIDDYGWAALYQTKKMCEFALTYNYDIFYHMIYDTDIDDFILSEINNNVVNKTYHRLNPKDKNHFWKVTLHFLSLDKNNLKYFSDRINFNEYVSKDNFLEGYVENILKDLNLTESDKDVRDLVRYVDSDDDNVFNYSVNSNYHIFFSKKENNVFFIIYNTTKNDNFLVKINNNIYNVIDSEVYIVNESEIHSFIVLDDNQHDEYCEVINKIVRNVIE